MKRLGTALYEQVELPADHVLVKPLAIMSYSPDGLGYLFYAVEVEWPAFPVPYPGAVPVEYEDSDRHCVVWVPRGLGPADSIIETALMGVMYSRVIMARREAGGLFGVSIYARVLL